MGWILLGAVLVLLYQESREHARLAESIQDESEVEVETATIQLTKEESDSPIVIAEPLAEVDDERPEPASVLEDEVVEAEVETEPEPEPQATTSEPEPEPEPEVEPEPEPAPIPVEQPPVYIDSSMSFAEAVAVLVHARTNTERAAAGRSPLQFDEELAEIAQNHSRDMYEKNYFSHISPSGCNLACRLQKESYDAWAWGENIAWRESTSLPSAYEVADGFVHGWLESQGHRENMLSEDYTHEGVGVIRVGNFVFITAVFADPQETAPEPNEE